MRLRRKARRAAVLCAILALTLPVAAAQAAPPDELGKADDFRPRPAIDMMYGTTGRWFIEFKSQPKVAGGSQQQINQERQAFLDEASKAGAPVNVASTYEEVFNGVAVNANNETAAQYAKLSTVRAVYPVYPVQAPKADKAKPQMSSAVGMTGVDVARNELGLTGKNIKVAIIDTGVDYNHPDLGGDGVNNEKAFPTKRVPLGWDFVGDKYNADPASPNYNPVAKPDAYPDDCQGHGTHVAGIVGAKAKNKDGVTGVAPDVQFAAYRVFGCGGSSDTQIILDAMERAKKDGVHVVNMSLGAAFQSWPNYPTGTAADKLVAAGIVVVASAGNSGKYFTQSTGAPSTGHSVISTASFDNVKMTLPGLEITAKNGPRTVGYTDSSGAPKISEALNGVPIAVAAPLNGCAAVPDAAGKILVMQRGECSFHVKALAAQTANAKALIIVNNAPGITNMSVQGDPAIKIPVIGLSKESGDWLLPQLEGAEATLKVTGAVTQEQNPTGGLVSDFSSWGLAADLTLKPDLGAPGGAIYSTIPLENGKYASLSGTSMSAPHVAGSVALMLEHNAKLKPAEVLARLQNTASVKPWNLKPELGVLDAAHHQGAGLIDLPRAATTTTVISPGKISAGEGADGPHTKVLTVSNSSDKPVTYALSYTPALGTWANYAAPKSNTQNSPGFFVFDAKVQFSQSEVSVPAKGQVDVSVTISPDEKTPEGATYTGYITFKDAAGTTAYTVPYAGMAGDYGKLPIHSDPWGRGIPSLGVITGCKIIQSNMCQDDDAKIELTDGSHIYKLGTDLPSIVTHFDQPVEKLTVNVLRVLPNGKTFPFAKPRHAFSADHLGRNSGLSVWQWDGYVDGPWGIRHMVLPGHFKLEMITTTADGDGNVQKYTTPTFQLQNWKEFWKNPIIWKP